MPDKKWKISWDFLFKEIPKCPQKFSRLKFLKVFLTMLGNFLIVGKWKFFSSPSILTNNFIQILCKFLKEIKEYF